jgi:manganese transport protein
VIPLIHLVSDRRWMGQHVIRRWLRIVAWAVAGIIVVLNLQLAIEEIGGWLHAAGSSAWVLWISVVPVGVGLLGLLIYITFLPAWQRARGLQARTPHGVHGPSEMPAVEPPHAPRHIAAAVDFSSADTAVLSYVVTLARAVGRGSRVTLLHVVESGAARVMGEEMKDQETRADRERLELYCSELAELGVEAGFDLGFGPPVDQLAALVEGTKSDLLIMGGHGHRRVGDIWHGTTVEGLRHRLSIPVLVVPPAGEKS